MKNKGLTAATAIGVFVVAFAGAGAVIGLGPNMPGLLAFASTPNAWHLFSDPASMGPIPTSMAPTFHRVKPGDMRPGEIDRIVRENAISNAKVAVKMHGLNVTDEVVEASFDDSPHAAGYAAYAPRDEVLSYTDEDRDQGEARDMKIGCFAIRDPDGKHTEHWVIKYTDTQMGGDEHAELWKWVVSGCAQSVQSGAATLSPAQVNVTMLGLMPKTADYDERRRSWQAHLTPQAAKRPIY